MQVNIEVTGLDELRNKLQEIQSRAIDTEPLMAELSNHLYNIVDESFQNEKTPDGKSWSPIKPRKSDRSPNKILRDEGDMQDSLTAQSSKDEAIIGFNATSNGYPYPIVHQFGTKDGKIESRAFMPIHEDGSLYDETEKELFEIVEDYMNEVLE